MKNILPFTIAFLLISCGNGSNQDLLNNLKEEDYRSVSVDFLNREILIPKNYTRVTLSQLRKNLLAIKSETKLVDMIRNGIARLELMPTEFIIFADRENFENCFWIQSGEYVDFDQSIASQYTALLEERANQEWSSIGLNYEKLENRFLQSGKSKIIKVKYRLEYEGVEKFQTQYIVTSNHKTFAIMISNYRNIDFEELVKRM